MRIFACICYVIRDGGAAFVFILHPVKENEEYIGKPLGESHTLDII